MDNYVTSGFYLFSYDGVLSSSVTNAPALYGYGLLVVFSSAASDPLRKHFQIYFPHKYTQSYGTGLAKSIISSAVSTTINGSTRYVGNDYDYTYPVLAVRAKWGSGAWLPWRYVNGY